jgi:predicted hotdog family 3-hydroxylacyl-ACP dehydratase
MEHAQFLAAARQLAAAADILAKSGPLAQRSDALQMHAQFGGYDRRLAHGASAEITTADDALFTQTAHAALTLVGRNEFAAAHALLQQAQRLLPA